MGGRQRWKGVGVRREGWLEGGGREVGWNGGLGDREGGGREEGWDGGWGREAELNSDTWGQ